MLKTISAALLAVSVLAAPALAAERRQDHASAGYQGRAGEDQRAERQCQDGPPSSQAFPPSSFPQADGRAQDAAVLEGHDQARCARYQARLKLIRGAWLDPHCPAAPADIRSGPRHCFPNGGGPVPCSGWPVSRDANSLSLGGRSRIRSDGNDWTGELHLGISAKRVAILLLPIALAACAGSDDGRSISPIPTIAASPTSHIPIITAPNCWRS